MYFAASTLSVPSNVAGGPCCPDVRKSERANPRGTFRRALSIAICQVLPHDSARWRCSAGHTSFRSRRWRGGQPPGCSGGDRAARHSPRFRSRLPALFSWSPPGVRRGNPSSLLVSASSRRTVGAPRSGSTGRGPALDSGAGERAGDIPARCAFRRPRWPGIRNNARP